MGTVQEFFKMVEYIELKFHLWDNKKDVAATYGQKEQQQTSREDTDIANNDEMRKCF